MGPLNTHEFAFGGIGHIDIDSFGAGSITVEPRPSSGARVEGSVTADQDLLDNMDIQHHSDRLRISVHPRHFQSSTAHLHLVVPPGLTYAITAGSADVSILADIQRAKILSSSGNIRIGQANDLDCSSGSGDISVARLSGRVGRLTTGSGDITVGEAFCPVSAKSGSGEVSINALHLTELRATSGSGDISVPSSSGSVDVRSASGSLAVGIADGLPAWLDLTSVSGGIRIDLEAAAQPAPGEPYASVRARTASGGIAVYRA